MEYDEDEDEMEEVDPKDKDEAFPRSPSTPPNSDSGPRALSLGREEGEVATDEAVERDLEDDREASFRSPSASSAALWSPKQRRRGEGVVVVGAGGTVQGRVVRVSCTKEEEEEVEVEVVVVLVERDVTVVLEKWEVWGVNVGGGRVEEVLGR